MAQNIYQAIQDNPGITAYGLKKMFNISYQLVQDYLLELYNICEDDDGRLFTVAWADAHYDGECV